MAICSYLVIPEEGRAGSLAERLASLPGCDVVPARNRDLLLLVTDTDGPDEDEALRSRLEGMEGLQALVLTFGEIDPETEEADPVARTRKRRRKDRRLPVVDGRAQGTGGGAGRGKAPDDRAGTRRASERGERP